MDIQTIWMNLQKHIVHTKKDAQENLWVIDELLATIVVYIYPFMDIVVKDKNVEISNKFSSLIEVLQPFVKKHKKRLSQFNQDALYQAILEEWVREIEYPFSLICPISPLFESIDSDNRVHLKTITFNGLLNRPFDGVLGEYGTMEYCPPVPNVTVKEPRQRKEKRMTMPCDDETYTEAIKEIKECFEALGRTRKNNPSCYRYDIFSKRELADWKSPQYAWQWNFTVEEYGKKIKELLKHHSKVLQQIIKKREKVNNEEKVCCKLLQLYVSEWYKREFNGNDSQGNAYSSIGLDNIPNISEKICKQLLGGDYKQLVFHDNADNTGDGRYTDTIYVDGGLPLNYLLKKENTAFRKTIEDIIESNYEGAEFGADNLGNLCNNQVINQSYKAKNQPSLDEEASIYDFIQAFVINGNLLIDGFEEFTKLIQEANNNQLQKKIDVRYKVFKTPNCFQLIPQLFFRKEPNDVHYALSQERLNAWGVHPQDNRFVMEVKAQEHTIWKKHFTKCLRGDYITFPKSDRSDLRIEDYLCLEKWNVLVDGLSINKKAIYNALQEKGYVQMYSTDGFSWYSRHNSNCKYTAVLFDRTKDNSLREDDKTNIMVEGKPSELFGWKQIDEVLSFTINGKEIKLYNKVGELFVEPNVKPLSDYYRENNKLYLIFSKEKPSFNVVYSKENNGDIISQILKEKEYKCEVKYDNDESFSNIDTISGCGYVKIKITRKENDKNITINCFAVPKEAKIQNHSDRNSKRTDFYDFDDLAIRYKDETLSADDNGVRRKYWGKFAEEDYHHPEAIYQVTDGVVNLELSVPKPLDATVVKKSNGSIVDVGRKDESQRLRLPILVLDKISVYQLPNNTPKEIDKFRFRSNAFNALIEHNYRKKYSLPDIYLDFQTFTHTRDNLGDIDLSGLDFIFVPTSDPLNYQTLSLNKDLPRFGIDSQEEGIVVQCIDKYEIPKILLKPIYIPENGNDLNLNEEQRRNKRNERINKYHDKYKQSKPDYNDALAYFEVAVRTGMYFGVFDALLGMIRHLVYPGLSNDMKLSDNAARHLTQFYKQYVEQGKVVDYAALWRMADEFIFDWCLIPQSEWNKVFDELLPVKELLRYRHHHIDWLSICLKDSANIQNQSNNIILRTSTSSFKRGRNSEPEASFWRLELNDRVKTLKTLSEMNFETISKYIQEEQ